VLSGKGWLKGVPLDPVVFKAHITHNVFMAFAAFLLAQAALDAATRLGRIVLAALCAAVVANVLLMVPGRTGIVVLLVLFVYFLCRRFRLKGLAFAGIALGALAVVVLASPESMLHKRVTLADEEYQQWRAGVPPAPTSSVGLRLELLRNTWAIIGNHPVIGVGTGGFGQAMRCGRHWGRGSRIRTTRS
jgi:O-antigen ligase